MDSYPEPIGERIVDSIDKHESELAHLLRDHSIRELQQFIIQSKLQDCFTPSTPDPDLLLPLNTEQQSVVDYFAEHVSKPLEETKDVKIRVLLTGTGGSGKSLVIKHVRELFKKANLKYFVCSPTGCSASLLGEEAVTIHSLFGIPCYNRGGFEQVARKLKPSKNLERKFFNTKLLIFDEVYMIGANLFCLVSNILQLAFQNQEAFGGVQYILLSGDLLQIPPVASTPLWHPPTNVGYMNCEGIELYRQFRKIFFLSQPVRQSKDVRYSELLNNLRRKKLTEEDITLLQSRRACVLSPEERAKFSDAIHIFPKNLYCREWNRTKIYQLNKPVTVLKSIQTPQSPDILVEDELIPVCVGARVRITKNLDLKHGITNGSTGEVCSIIWDKSSPQDKIPAVLLIKFDNKRAPAIGDLTPIGPSIEYIYDNISNTTFKVKSFSVDLNYGLTCHKIQGQTLDKAAVFLDATESFQHSTYVQLSRVQCLDDLLILDSSVSLSRFQHKSFFKNFDLLREEFNRLGIGQFFDSDAKPPNKSFIQLNLCAYPYEEDKKVTDTRDPPYTLNDYLNSDSLVENTANGKL